MMVTGFRRNKGRQAETAHEKAAAGGQRRLLTHYSRGDVSPRLIKPYLPTVKEELGAVRASENWKGRSPGALMPAPACPAWRIGMTAPALSPAGAVSHSEAAHCFCAGLS